MLACEIILNNQKLYLAGVDGTGVVTIVVNLPKSEQLVTEEENSGSTLFDGSALFHIGGIVTDHAENETIVRWEKELRTLKCGDTLVIKLTEADQIDSPAVIEPHDPDWKKKFREKMQTLLKEKDNDSPRQAPKQWVPAKLNCEVYLNDGKLCVAGTGGMGVASIDIVLFRKKKKTKPEDGKNAERFFEDANFDVGGLLTDQTGNNNYVDWVERRKLSCGDTILLKFMDNEPIDPPIAIRPCNLDKKK